jgi:hypothetical protein
MTTVDAFFSCSFETSDAEVTELIKAIAQGMGFYLTNVSSGSPHSPPTVAKAKIAAAQCLIAVCTKRAELASGKWVMPQAVQDEIAIAFGTDTPTLMLIEEGIDVAGFKPNFGTYQAFDRSKLAERESLRSLVEALQNLRSSVTEAPGKYSLGLAGSHAEFVNHLVELEPEGDDFIWSYATSKKLIYTHPSRGSFPAGVWASVPSEIPGGASPIIWQVETISSSRGIQVVAEIEKQDPACVEARLRMEPPPEPADYVEYRTYTRSRYLNPVWSHEAQGAPIHLEQGTYRTFDGLLFIHKTQRAIIEFRFARSYGLKPDDVVPFVGSYTSGFDYEIESEKRRALIRVEELGGTVSARFEVENPLPNAMYGVAWNPRHKPSQGS